MKKFLYLFLLFSGFAMAQPKLGQTLKSTSGESIETPLGFQAKETVKHNKVDYAVGIDKSSKVIFIETRSNNFKVENYSLATKFNDFKNYNYTRYFDGWGYYLRINASWCAYFGKTKPTKDTKPFTFFNYNFGSAEGKAVFDSDYKEILEGHQKLQQEKAQKKEEKKQAKVQKKEEYEKNQAELAKQQEAAKKEELKHKEKLKAEKIKAEKAAQETKKQAEENAKKKKEEFEAQKKKEQEEARKQKQKELDDLAKLKKEEAKKQAEKDAKKKQEEERKQQYARELAEYNAKKEAEKKAKEAEMLRKSEEFRTGQAIQNTNLAQDSGNKGGSSSSATNLPKTLTGGQKLLDDVLKSKLKKGLNDYISYIQKNKKRTEDYPLVLVNYKDITEMSADDLKKIKKVVSTTVFKKGHKRTLDFKDKGANGVVIIKAE